MKRILSDDDMAQNKYIIDKDLTITIPDDIAVLERIVRIYRHDGNDDYLKAEARYAWLYKIMYQCVSDIKGEK